MLCIRLFLNSFICCAGMLLAFSGTTANLPSAHGFPGQITPFSDVAYCCQEVTSDSAGVRAGSGCHIIADSASGFASCSYTALSCDGESWIGSRNVVTDCLPDGGFGLAIPPEVRAGACCVKSCGDFCGQTCTSKNEISACLSNFYFECPSGTGMTCSGSGVEKDCQCKKP